ncbi:hypothetical protein ACNJRW_21055 [Stenotrophomonas maltophilia]|nr:hypothetical protein [Stenotrophomonas maltophilia]
MNHTKSWAAASMIVLGLVACGKSPSERAAAEGQPAAVSNAQSAGADAAPASPVAGVAQKYEGKVVRQPATGDGKADGWYYVTQGKRHWIINASWLDEKGLSSEDVIEITAEEFQSIPEDAQALGDHAPAGGS